MEKIKSFLNYKILEFRLISYIIVIIMIVVLSLFFKYYSISPLFLICIILGIVIMLMVLYCAVLIIDIIIDKILE